MKNSSKCSKLVFQVAIVLVLFLNIELSFRAAARALDSDSKVYIVYLGEREHDDHQLVANSHHQMLESLLESKEDAHNSMIYSYHHGFSGFAALLTSSQAKKMLEHPKVVHVTPNRILKVQTTRTWDYLSLSSNPTSSPLSSSGKGLLRNTNMGSEAIIGLLDTGIWPESKVFSDEGLGPIPERWRGKCVSGEHFEAKIHCNNKLIGAKYYLKAMLAEMGGKFNRTIVRDFKSNRDAVGHGTHTATIAAGSFVPNVSFYGLAQGTVRGGAPRARIASYKVCWNNTGDGGAVSCSYADMWKAYDDAIHDRVDVLSVSIGGGVPVESDISLENVAEFHAVAKGIPVVASAGNDGPGAQTLDHTTPWILTVAATTLDRSFPTKITLGNNRTLFVQSLFTGPQVSTGLVFGDSQNDDNVDVNGKIVLFFDNIALKGKGPAGVIIAAGQPQDVLAPPHDIPVIYVDYELGTEILHYIRTTRSPMVKISAATTLIGPPIATKVAAFSSRGPSSFSPAILKPDIAAPGANILAALSPFDRKSYNGFGMDSGTSMSTPVISGVIALLKSLHPDWSPAAFRSALVTTAWRTSPSGEPIFAQGSSEKLADPFDYGGGLVNPEKAAQPGLVYDMGIKDYIHYLCSVGHNSSSISRVLGKKTSCSTPKPSILDINLPSITIPNLEKEVTVTRTVTNVGPIKSVYRAVIESPLGIKLTVKPRKLVFSSAANRTASFLVKVKTNHKVNTGYLFGSLTWTDGVHDVKIPVSVRTKIMIKDLTKQI